MLEYQLGQHARLRGTKRQVERYRCHSTKIVAAVLIFWFHVIGIRAALVLYCLLAIVQIRQKPGLQYDEALSVMGAVHLRHQPRQEFTLPHDPNTWIHVRSRWLPLMTV